MAHQAGTLEMYPPGGPGAPKDRQGHAGGTTSGLPAGTLVFSADNHISVSEDIFFERSPESMRDRVPRVVNQDGAWTMNVGERPLLPREFAGVLMQYDPLPGSSTGELDTRLDQLEADGVSRELAFPNALLGLMGYPDLEARELSFRIYNEYLAELQARSNNRFYGVGLINWWDGAGAQRTLDELKSFGITTFWLPLKAGKNEAGEPIDYNSAQITPVWEAIEASGLPVSHHIGEGMISGPCAKNGYAVSMVHNSAPFREMFGRYVCTGLLDRHKGLKVGWFEGGINWVPSAIQDAEHMYTSYLHTSNVEMEQSPQYYWDTHMYASFMIDPLGLDLIDRIGRHKVMWSTDFPHIESTFGYSERSLTSVVDKLGPADAVRAVSQNVLDYLGLPRLSATLSVPAETDLTRVRMQRDRWAKLQANMAEKGVGTLVLLGNSNVSYATGASWPLADPGRANVDRPAAVVVAGDDAPHFFSALGDLVAQELSIPPDHLHGPVFPECDEGAEAFCSTLAALVPGDGRLAIDEFPGSMRRQFEVRFPDARPAGADEVVGACKLVKTPDELGFLRAALRITEEAIAPVQAALAPGIRQSDLTATFLRGVFDHGAEANILDPIWQVMPKERAGGPWTTHGDIACPLLTTERELEAGDVLWVDTGISYAGFSSDFGRTWVVGQDPSPQQKGQYRKWRQIMDAVLAQVRAGATGADLTRAALEVTGGHRPWMHHFYLAHGLGIESAESPFIGTDLGDAYDERQVLEAGMVVVFEPLVWEDGASGYRSEEVVAITEDGFIPLTDYPYDPYAD